MSLDRVGERGRRPADPRKFTPGVPSAELFSVKLPHSEESEQAVLAAILLSPNLFHAVAAVLLEEDFYFERHQLIWRALAELEGANPPIAIDLRTLQAQLEAMGDGAFDKVGGMAYLSSLDLYLPDLSHIKNYCDVVLKRAVRRGIILSGQAAIRAAMSGGDEDEAELAQILEHGATTAFDRLQAESTMVSFAQAMDIALDEAERAEHEPETVFTPTGWRDLDRMLNGGLRKGRSYIIAGRPGMGKTSMLYSLARNICLRDDSKKAGIIFSLEMPTPEAATCILSTLSRVPKESIAKGELSRHQWDALVETRRRYGGAQLFIDDDSSLTPAMLNSKVKRRQQVLEAEGIELAFVGIDYLQLVDGGGRFENRQTEVASISRKIKKLAKSLDLPLILLCQLNRQTERRTDPRPGLADLRESGSLEQDADGVLFIYRDEVYHKDDPNTEGMAELIIAKLRGGKTGVLNWRWRGEFGVFEEIDTHHGEQTEISR